MQEKDFRAMAEGTFFSK